MLLPGDDSDSPERSGPGSVVSLAGLHDPDVDFVLLEDDLPAFEIVVDPDLATDVDGSLPVLGGGVAAPFCYIGRGLTLDGFVDYVNAFDFGAHPPTFVVLHHTSLPDASWGKLKTGSWDAGELGLSSELIYRKRLGQLTAVMRYYARKSWDRGPHLFIDDRWIWLFSPMDGPGIHARTGNGTETSFSVGIEVVGHFAKKRWPKTIETLVGGAVATLQRKLGTFELAHAHGAGGLSSHREWGKPACPGEAITDDYWLNVIQREARTTRPISDDAASAPRSTDPYADVVVNTTFRCVGNGLRIRQAPNSVSPIAGTLSFGNVVQIDVIKPHEELVIDTRAWGHLADGRGFVSMRYLEPIA